MHGILRVLIVLITMMGIEGLAGATPCAAKIVVSTESQQWMDKVIGALVGPDACFSDRPAFAKSDCNIFAGIILERLYGLVDFVNPQAAKGFRYLTSNEIAIALWTARSGDWELLGTMAEQSALDLASARAANRTPVIAVWRNSGSSSEPGHIALIGPGPMTESPSLQLRTPVSASFFQGRAADNYVGKPLACAFSKQQISEVRLYARRSKG